MKKILKYRRLLIALVVIALIFVGLRLRNNGSLDRIIPSKKNAASKEVVFIQTAKKFALTIPTKWSVTEPTSGRQTFIYPTGNKISGADAQALIDQEVVIVETATNKKDSFAALIDEIKSNLEQSGSTVEVNNKEYNDLKASQLVVNGQTNYQQIFFNTSTIIILTGKNDHPILEDLAKSLTIDLAKYADNIKKASDLVQQTNQNIANSKFSDIYNNSSKDLKKIKTEEEFGNLLKGVSEDFNKTILVWGVFVNEIGLGAAVNIVEQDKIIRRGSFYYLKDKDNYLLDSLRISGKLNQ